MLHLHRRIITLSIICAVVGVVGLTVMREIRFARLQRRYAALQSRLVEELQSGGEPGFATANDTPHERFSDDRQARAGGTLDPSTVDRDAAAFFRAIDLLVAEHTRREETRARTELIGDGRFQAALEQAGLHVEEGSGPEVVLRRGTAPRFVITVQPDAVEIRAWDGTTVREPTFGAVSSAFLRTPVADEADAPERATDRVSGGAPGGDPGDRRPTDSDPGRTAVPDGSAAHSDDATDSLRDGDEPEATGLARVKRILDDPGFGSMLAHREIVASRRPRETDHFLYFELSHREAGVLGSFAVQRATGEIWLMDDGDVPIMSLRRAGEGTSAARRIRSSLSGQMPDMPESGLTVLLLGINEDVADSIMLAHVDPNRQRTHFFSLPRDLYFRGGRINQIYHRHGREQTTLHLSAITGMTIDHTIAVDMFAFVDVINILGGVTIELEEELIDPTYRVRDNGEWGTLYYPPGHHHLNGVEALRIARSRFTTTDFGRARRQQDIVDAIRGRIASLGIRDIGTLHTLIQRLMHYVDTDMDVIDALRAIARYGRFTDSTHHVLSTDNVLFSAWSALHFAGLTEDDVDEEYDRGAWILLPHDGDWDLIPRFIRGAIAGR